MKLTQASTPIQLLNYLDEDVNLWELTLQETQHWHQRVTALTNEQIQSDCRTIGFTNFHFYISLRRHYISALAKEVELIQAGRRK